MNEKEGSLGFQIKPSIAFTSCREMKDEVASVVGIVIYQFVSSIRISKHTFNVLILKKFKKSKVTKGIV